MSGILHAAPHNIRRSLITSITQFPSNEGWLVCWCMRLLRGTAPPNGPYTRTCLHMRTYICQVKAEPESVHFLVLLSLGAPCSLDKSLPIPVGKEFVQGSQILMRCGGDPFLSKMSQPVDSAYFCWSFKWGFSSLPDDTHEVEGGKLTSFFSQEMWTGWFPATLGLGDSGTMYGDDILVILSSPACCGCQWTQDVDYVK